jgi:hypothetical protein
MPTVNINGFTQLDNGPYPSVPVGLFGFSDNVSWVLATTPSNWLCSSVRPERSRPGERQRNFRRRQQSERPLRFADTGFSGNTNPGIADWLGQFNSYAEIGPATTPSRAVTCSNFRAGFMEGHLETQTRTRRARDHPPTYYACGVITTCSTPLLRSQESGLSIPDRHDHRAQRRHHNGMVIPGDSFPDAGRTVPSGDPR